MHITRTAPATRTKLAATAAALAALTLVLTGCGGAADGSNNNTSDASGAWIATKGPNGGGDVLVVDGSSIIYATPTTDKGSTCNSTTALLKAARAGSIDLNHRSDNDAYRVVSTGTIDNGRTSVTWDDNNGSNRTGEDVGPGSISIRTESIALDYIFSSGVDDPEFVHVDGDAGKAVAAKACN